MGGWLVSIRHIAISVHWEFIQSCSFLPEDEMLANIALKDIEMVLIISSNWLHPVQQCRPMHREFTTPHSCLYLSKERQSHRFEIPNEFKTKNEKEIYVN